MKGQIEPHVALVWLPQTLLLKNSEPIGHNFKSEFFANTQFSDLIPANVTAKKTFTKSESRPMPVACNIHTWEIGWLLIRDNPYMAVSDSQGKLQIKNLPAGTHTLQLWHERNGYLKDIKRDGKAEMLPLGRLTIEIKPGNNNLGEILIEPK